MPHRRGRKRPKTRGGRTNAASRSSASFAWLGNFRRLNVRYECHAANFRGFVLLGCLLILLRPYLGEAFQHSL